MTAANDSEILNRISDLLDGSWSVASDLIERIGGLVRETGRPAAAIRRLHPSDEVPWPPLWAEPAPPARPLPLPDSPVAELALSTRASNILRRLGASTIADAADLDDQDISDARMVGEKTLREIRWALAPYRTEQDEDAA